MHGAYLDPELPSASKHSYRFTLSFSRLHLVSLQVSLTLDNINKPHPTERRPVSTPRHLFQVGFSLCRVNQGEAIRCRNCFVFLSRPSPCGATLNVTSWLWGVSSGDSMGGVVVAVLSLGGVSRTEETCPRSSHMNSTVTGMAQMELGPFGHVHALGSSWLIWVVAREV